MLRLLMSLVGRRALGAIQDVMFDLVVCFYQKETW